MKTLREMMDLIESAQRVAEGTSTVSNEDLADLIHDIVVNLIFHKQKMSIRDTDPTLVANEVKKAYKMEGIPFAQNDLDRVLTIFPKVMSRLRKGFKEDQQEVDEDASHDSVRRIEELFRNK